MFKFIISFILIIGFLFCSCEGKEGPAGPTGEQGLEGEQGVQGPRGYQGENAEILIDIGVFKNSINGWWTIETNFILEDYIVTVHVRKDETVLWQEPTWYFDSNNIYIKDDEYCDSGYDCLIKIAG